MENKEDLRYWLGVIKIPQLGSVRIKELLEVFGSAKAIWQAQESDLGKIKGIGPNMARSIIENRNKIDLDYELNHFSTAGIEYITLENENYPSPLKNIYDPPPILFVNGKLLKEDEKAVAIVGTRNCSEYGRDLAYQFGKQLAQLGITVVSGLALGIDGAAHRGALDGGGRTIACLGTGLDRIYPSDHRSLAKDIVNNGALVTEFALGSEPGKFNFPRRNRIISGLSLGVLVVEGAQDSGALITARQALEQGREVFAIPGDLSREQSKGPHSLIKEGAKLVESVEDILEELNIEARLVPSDTKEKDYGELLSEEKEIVEILKSGPLQIDLIVQKVRKPIQEISAILMIMELKKIVRQIPGIIFELNK